MGELTVLIEGPVAVEEVEVHWTGESVEISAEARRRIDEQWQRHVAAATAEGRALFNGGVTRLIGVEDLRAAREGGGGGEGGGVRLRLGPADYKTFLVTVLRDRAWFLAQAPEAMALALGNSMLLTHGDRALLGVRSMQTSAYEGRAHLIGGVLEPLGTAELEASGAGLMAHLWREMREEAGVTPADAVSGPVLLAVVRDEFLAQPEMIWQCEVSVGLEDVARRLGAHEHEAGILIEKGEVAPAMYEQMTPVARAAWERWRLQ